MVDWQNVISRVRAKFTPSSTATTPSFSHTSREEWLELERKREKLMRKGEVTPRKAVKWSEYKPIPTPKKFIEIKYETPENIRRKIEAPSPDQIKVDKFSDVPSAVGEGVTRAQKTIRDIPAETVEVFGKGTGIDYLQEKIREKTMGFSEKEFEEKVGEEYEGKIKEELDFEERQSKIKEAQEKLKELQRERQTEFKDVQQAFEDPSTSYEQDILFAEARGFKVKEVTEDGKEYAQITDPEGVNYNQWRANLEAQGFEVKNKPGDKIEIIDVKTQEKLKELEKSGELEKWQKDIIKEQKRELAGGAGLFYAKTAGVGAVAGATGVLFPPYRAYLGAKMVTSFVSSPVETWESITADPGETGATIGGFVIGSTGAAYAKYKLTQPQLQRIKSRGELKIRETSPGTFEIKQDIVGVYKKPFSSKTFTVKYKAFGSGTKLGSGGYAFGQVGIKDVKTGKLIGGAKSITVSKLSDVSSFISKTIKTEAGSYSLTGEIKPEKTKVYDYDSYILSGSRVKIPKAQVGFDRFLNIFRTSPKKTIPQYKLKYSKYRAAGQTAKLDFSVSGADFKTEFYTTLPGNYMKEFFEFNPQKLFDASGRLRTYGQKGGLYLSQKTIPVDATTAVTYIAEPSKAIQTGSVVPKIKPKDVLVSDKQAMSFYNSLKNIYGETKAPATTSAVSGFTEAVKVSVPKTIVTAPKPAPSVTSTLAGTGAVTSQKTREGRIKFEGRFTPFAEIDKQRDIWKDYQGRIARDTTKEKQEQKQRQTALNKLIKASALGTVSGIKPKQDITQLTTPVQIQNQLQGQDQLLLQDQTTVTTTSPPPPATTPGLRFQPPFIPIESKKRKKKPIKRKLKRKKVKPRYRPSIEAMLGGLVGQRPKGKLTGIERRPGTRKVDKELRRLIGF